MKVKLIDIDAAGAKKLRDDAKLPQHKFWPAVGVPQSSGCRYEAGSSPIPRTVRALLNLRYLAGIEFDASILMADAPVPTASN